MYIFEKEAVQFKVIAVYLRASNAGALSMGLEQTLFLIKL